MTLGGTYYLTEALYTSASATYEFFNADDDYVYGEEDGQNVYGYFGVGWKF